MLVLHVNCMDSQYEYTDMSSHIRIDAPAKVNLYLKILAKRPDGYHEIVTIFERIDLVDTISIVRMDRGIDVLSDTRIVARKEENLAYKAARAILGRASFEAGVRIHIDKKIPIAAGLGGGSSDAASVLMGINTLLRLKMTREELMGLGRELGADVPFFLAQSPFAIGTGRGDTVKPIRSRKTFYHLLVCPDFPLLTRDVYKEFGSLRSGEVPGFSSRDAALSEPVTGFTSRDLTPRLRSGSSPEHWSKGLTNTVPGDTIDAVSIFNTIAGGIHPPSFAYRGLRRLSLQKGDVRRVPPKGATEAGLHNDLQVAAIKVRRDIEGIVERLAEASGTKAIVSGSGPSVFCLFHKRKEAQEARNRFLRSLPAREKEAWKIFVVRTLYSR